MKTMRKACMILLVFSLLINSVLFLQTTRVQAADKRLSLQQAQKLALANSDDYQKIQNKIELQEIKYATAVKSIQMKKKNMSTFRWTPLLNFKFPEQPTLADEYEWQYKPLQITCTITELKHQLQDEVIASKEELSLLYIEAYICQEKISFLEESLEKTQKNLAKNQVRLAIGEANQSDIDKMQQKVSKLTTDICLQMRTFETTKSKISRLIGMDVTSGYAFENPFVEVQIPREALESLQKYTLQNDQSFYETKLETALSRTSLDMMQRMMQNQYGGKMDYIMTYINQAKNGEKINSAAFKAAYNNMLTAIDAPWNGVIRILFIKINKEWFKGAVDGSRYVEDDPYALYSGALEYADAIREQASAEIELTNQVKDGFETLQTAQIAYTDAQNTSNELEQELEKSTQLNKLGMFTYEELSALEEEYETQQLDTFALLSEYSKQIYSYDRLTCGGITAYLEGTDMDMKAAQGGNSYLAEALSGEVYYYITYKIEDNIFRFGISVPEDYSLDITHFELYVDGTQIGEKTEAAKQLEHLALDLDMVDKVSVYLYNEDELVAVCDIDSSIEQDKLEITGGYTLEKKDTIRTVANYRYLVEEEKNLVNLTITKKETENIAYYRLKDSNGAFIGGEDMIPITDTFTYLSLLVGNLDEVEIEFYDAEETKLYTGTFDTLSASIVVME